MDRTIDAETVEAFLLSNPDFLQDRPALLAALTLPHGGPGAVSLVERQVALLRERNIVARRRLAKLSEIGRENDRLLEATRITILALLKAKSPNEIGQIWCEQIILSFGSEYAALHWYARAGLNTANICPEAEMLVRKLITRENSVSGSFRAEEMQLLFSEELKAGSAAIAGIYRGEEIIGCIAVGSNDARRYSPEDGTLFLDYLAEVISQLPACQ